jgi:hypothetical protein
MTPPRQRPPFVADERTQLVGWLGLHPGFPAAQATLRWMLIHMVEETARHVGHLDAIRELLDGKKGYY